MCKLDGLYGSLHSLEDLCVECGVPDCEGCSVKYDKDKIRNEITEEIRRLGTLTLSD